MYEKKIKYKDYNGNEREETFYFNLKKSEILEMQLSEEGGLISTLQRIVETQDAPQIIKYFKKIILASYGVKSPDGVRFMKSEKLSKDFEDTEAYSELIIEMYSNVDFAAEFIKGVMPDLDEESMKEIDAKVMEMKNENS